MSAPGPAFFAGAAALAATTCYSSLMDAL